MEEINYLNGFLWYSLWPITIYVSYKFIRINIEHLENNIENNNTKINYKLKRQ